MMGRISYTNRRIDGPKLASVAVKDLLKRMPPASGHKSALRDPIVELDFSSKSLDDTCFDSIANALATTILSRGELGRTTTLEELCLNHNKLGVKALEPLGRIIRLSRCDLRDLDISYNAISIVSDEDAEIFQDFLRSFSDCCMLRRIDFSGNDLSPKAFEILARVYGEQSVEFHTMSAPPQAPDKGMRKLVLKPLKDLDANLNEPLSASARRKSRSLATKDRIHLESENESPLKESSDREVSNPWDVTASYMITRGLRSVPYLIFQNTNMSDACALYLSYILTVHGSPEQLLLHVPPAKAGPPTQQLASYDVQTGCLGIVYRPNRKLGAVGIRLLELAEQLRAGFSDGSDGDNSSFGLGLSPESRRTSTSTADWRRPSTWSSSSATRRTSNTSSSEDPDQDFQGFMEKTLSSVETTRHRIQGDILREHGPLSNDMWSLALRILELGRIFSLPLPDPGKGKQREMPDATPENHAPIVDEGAYSSLMTPLQKKWKAHQGAPMLRLGRKWVNDREEIVQIPLSPRITPFAKMELENPVATKESLWPHELDSKAKPKPQDHFKHPYVSALLMGFSEDVWRRIIAGATDAHTLTSETQQLSAIKYALDRKTLASEAENLGKPWSAQCWKVLNGMGMLDYEMNA